MPTLFPTLNTPAVNLNTDNIRAAAPVVWGTAPLFDFTQNKFLFDDSGDLILGSEAVTLSQRITAMLITPRLVYKIYGLDFGSDFSVLRRKNYPVDVLKKLGKSLTQAAVQDPRVTTLKNIVVKVMDNYLMVDFSIMTVAGYQSQFQGKWSV